MSRLLSLVAAVCAIAFMVSQTQSQARFRPIEFDGMQIFRFDTFGDEQLWTDELQMQHVLKNVTPETALSVGLKIDSDALPPSLINAIKAVRSM